MGYEANVEELARAIVLGRWKRLDFKAMAAVEAAGSWIGKPSTEDRDWATLAGLFYAMWEPIVCVYTLVHQYDRTAHRVLTEVCSETQAAIRGGVPTADAVSGLITRFFALVEDAVRALQRGTGELVILDRVWERCKKRPFFNQYQLQTAANRLPGVAAIEKLTKRILALEGQAGSYRPSGPYAGAVTQGRYIGGGGGSGAGSGAAGGSGAPAGHGEQKGTIVSYQGRAGGGGPAPFIPAKELGAWQDKNPGKCFYYHLKGHCSSGGRGAACPRGEH